MIKGLIANGKAFIKGLLATVDKATLNPDPSLLESEYGGLQKME